MFNTILDFRFKKHKLIKLLILILIGISVDMLIGGSLYHPIRLLYRPTSYVLCFKSSDPSCTSSERRESHATGKHGFVSSSHYMATEIGLDILKSGGNSVDAAIAIGYSLSVLDPCCGNLGGGGFMLIRFPNGESSFINFRETAPNKIESSLFLNKNGEIDSDLKANSYLSVAIPGTVLGFEKAHEKYGNLSRKKIIEPALKLANNGFILKQSDAINLRQGKKVFKRDSYISSIFLNKDHKSLKAGDRLVQKDLANSLQSILIGGSDAFYKGNIAKYIVKESRGKGGVISESDFSNYSITETQPLVCKYRDYQVMTSPLPGGGTTLCQMLKIIESEKLTDDSRYSSKTLHKLLSAMYFSYIDRNLYLADPKFSVVEKDLLSKPYIDSIVSKIPVYKAPTQKVPPSFYEGSDTTHYSVVDKSGMAVSVTYTINTSFGSGLMAKGTGFFLNNEMDDFTIKLGNENSYGLVQSSPNLVEPGKQPLSSMTPTIVTKDGKLILVTGSPGGSTIPSTVFQVLINTLDYNMPISEALNTPRLHYQASPNFVITEPFALPTNVFSDLWKRGYKVIPYGNWGGANSIYFSDGNRSGTASSDTRKSTSSANVIP